MITNRTPGVKHKVTRVSDGIDVGIYTWKMEDGKVLGDKDGNVLNVLARRGDLVAMAKIANFVRNELGIEGGEPYFLEGAFPQTEGEYADQMEQMLSGQVPDADLGSLKDDIRRARGGR